MCALDRIPTSLYVYNRPVGMLYNFARPGSELEKSIMDILNTDFSFGRHDSSGASLIREILAQLRMWRLNAGQKHRQRRRTTRPFAIDNHLLRDIGITRLGMSEATLASQNEAGFNSQN